GESTKRAAPGQGLYWWFGMGADVVEHALEVDARSNVDAEDPHVTRADDEARRHGADDVGAQCSSGVGLGDPDGEILATAARERIEVCARRRLLPWKEGCGEGIVVEVGIMYRTARAA